MADKKFGLLGSQLRHSVAKHSVWFTMKLIPDLSFARGTTRKKGTFQNMDASGRGSKKPESLLAFSRFHMAFPAR